MSESRPTNQVLIPEVLRDSIREHPKIGLSDDEMTYSDFVRGSLPPEGSDVHHGFDNSVHIKLTDDVDERLSELAGFSVTKGEVLAYYVLPRLFEAGVLEEADDLAVYLSYLVLNEHMEDNNE